MRDLLAFRSGIKIDRKSLMMKAAAGLPADAVNKRGEAGEPS